MRRRELLSGIVPVVAGAASACKSSVADVLTGINTQDSIATSGAMVSREIVVFMIVKQWLHTFMKNDDLIIPFCCEPKETASEYEKEEVTSFKFTLDTSDDFNSERFESWNVVCDDAFDCALESFIRISVAKVLAEKLSSMQIVKVSGVGDVSRVVKCGRSDVRDFTVDVYNVPGLEYRRYWASEESSPIVRVWVEPDFFWMSKESHDSKLRLEVHIGFSASKNTAQICFTEGAYMEFLGGRWVPDIAPAYKAQA